MNVDPDSWINAGMYLINRDVIASLPSGPLSLERDVLPSWVSEGRLFGYRNTGGLSVHPDNHTVLEPGMVLSVEPMLNNEYGYYDLEDQYLVTQTGREPLHELAPEELPVISA